MQGLFFLFLVVPALASSFDFVSEVPEKFRAFSGVYLGSLPDTDDLVPKGGIVTNGLGGKETDPKTDVNHPHHDLYAFLDEDDSSREFEGWSRSGAKLTRLRHDHMTDDGAGESDAENDSDVPSLEEDIPGFAEILARERERIPVPASEWRTRFVLNIEKDGETGASKSEDGDIQVEKSWVEVSNSDSGKWKPANKDAPPVVKAKVTRVTKKTVTVAGKDRPKEVHTHELVFECGAPGEGNVDVSMQLRNKKGEKVRC